MTHPDGTPYWTAPEPTRPESRAEITWDATTREAHTIGGNFLGRWSLDDLAMEYEGIIIRTF